MAIYKISYSRIEYSQGKSQRQVFLGSVLLGELNYLNNINDLPGLGRKRGIKTLTIADEMLAIETEEFVVKRLFDWNKMTEFYRSTWEFAGAETY